MAVLARRGYGSGATYAAVPVRLVCRACLPAPARLLAARAAVGQGSSSALVHSRGGLAREDVLRLLGGHW
jgi:hypothetical protein